MVDQQSQTRETCIAETSKGNLRKWENRGLEESDM